MTKISTLAALVSVLAVTACGLHTASKDGAPGDEPVLTSVDAAGAPATQNGSAGCANVAVNAGGADAGSEGGAANDAGSTVSNVAGTTAQGGSASVPKTGGSDPVVTDPCSDGGAAGAPAVDAGGSAAGGTTSAGGTAAEAGAPAEGGAAPTGGTASTGGTSSAGGSAPTAGTGGSGGDVIVPDNADVVVLSEDGKSLFLSNRYTFSATCNMVLGNMPGVGWDTGVKSCDTDKDGYVEYAPKSGTVGTYTFSYRDADDTNGWALYGAIELLKGMSSEARSFVECNWWNAATKKTVEVANASCSLKATFGATGIVGAGNMANLQ